MQKAVAAALAGAAHVTTLKVESTRVVPSPMEPRACLVAHEPKGDRYTVHVCLQGMNMMRKQLAAYSGVAEERLTIVARDVGGGFGQRSTAYPEYCAVMLAAKATGRPVKWVSSRSEAFLSDTHGRGIEMEGTLALDRDGKFLAMRMEFLCDMGGYLSPAGAVSHLRNPTVCLTGVYRIPALYGHWRTALTNAAPIAAYRGAGRPDIAYAIERLVQQAAYETGSTRRSCAGATSSRRRPFPTRRPPDRPTSTPSSRGCSTKRSRTRDWKGFEVRRKAAGARGKLRGIGLSTVIENTGAGMFPKDEIALEAGDDGVVTAYSVSHSQGQGHETTFAMIIAKVLGIPAGQIAVRQAVAEKPLIGNHTGGSRTMVGAGSVCAIAAGKLIEHGKSLAAEHFHAEPSQVDYAAGVFRVRDGARSITLAELARARPEGRSLAVVGEGNFGSTFPNGCHVAEVEIDPRTGATEIVAYTAVDDCGQVINHAIVEGQMHGALAQGAGQVFGEHAVYDPESGQMLTGSFMDYCMPRAGMLPEPKLGEHPTPSKVSPLGVKGMGESGCTASLGALANAMTDALRPLGVPPLDMPFSPGRVWQAIAAAKGGR